MKKVMYKCEEEHIDPEKDARKHKKLYKNKQE